MYSDAVRASWSDREKENLSGRRMAALLIDFIQSPSISPGTCSDSLVILVTSTAAMACPAIAVSFGWMGVPASRCAILISVVASTASRSLDRMASRYSQSASTNWTWRGEALKPVHLRAGFRRINFGSRSEKVSRRIAHMEADLKALQKESDTLTGRVDDP